jgi:hypothetical protein
MSDGREEREEQEQRRKWEKEKKDRDDDLDRDWERDGDRERRDSRSVVSDGREYVYVAMPDVSTYRVVFADAISESAKWR